LNALKFAIRDFEQPGQCYESSSKLLGDGIRRFVLDVVLNLRPGVLHHSAYLDLDDGFSEARVLWQSCSRQFQSV
jgi:hypothetical protein